MPSCFISTCDLFILVMYVLRFTLFNREGGQRMRLEMDEDDKVSEIMEIIDGCMDVKDYMLCNGYSILDPADRLGDCVGYNNIVDILPDPDLLPP